MSRPELTGHASLYYNEREARKYDSSSRMVGIQREITERAIELLKLSNRDGTMEPKFVLDVGCGSGLSGQVLQEHGHVWVGCDVSRDMLSVANERMQRIQQKSNNQQKDGDDAMHVDNEDDSDDSQEEEDDDFSRVCTGDLMHHDMGTGLPFRPATFDACISISALQWLCYSNTAQQIPKRRLTRFFSSLYTVLKRGGRAVLQFYPETSEQAVLISECAARVGFAGGIVVDYPNSAKAKKHYLVLTFDKAFSAPQGLTTAAPGALGAGVRIDSDEEMNNKRKRPPRKKKGMKTKEWILHKKETQRRRGKNVRPDTKYTARRRSKKF